MQKMYMPHHKKLILLSTLITYLCQFARATQLPGTLDTSFAAPLGYATFSNPTTAHALLVGNNNSIFTGSANLSSQFAVAKFTNTGAVDSSFGTAGIASVTIGASSMINALAFDAQGNLVAGGISPQGSSSQFALARFTPAGVLDTTFGSPNGYIITAIPGASSSTINTIAMGAQGVIYAAGFAVISGKTYLAITKYDTSGNLITSFGANGIVTKSVDTEVAITALTVDALGNLIAGGYAQINGILQFFITKYSYLGIEDGNFGESAGYTTTIIGSSSQINALALDDHANILVGGVCSNPTPRFVVARYTSDGLLDSTFNPPTGYVNLAIGTNDVIKSILIDQDDGVIAGGFSTSGVNNFTLARFDKNGALDTSFGSSPGYTVTNINTSFIDALAFDSNNNIIATGAGDTNETAIARYFGIITDIPTAQSNTIHVPTNVPASIMLTANDSQGTLLTFSIVSGPSHGTLSAIIQPTSAGTTQTASVFYTPNNSFSGQDSFTFIINNGVTNSTPATVTLPVVNASNNSFVQALIRKYFNMLQS
jgi:uncharacterized delta-60 repeat protein